MLRLLAVGLRCLATRRGNAWGTPSSCIFHLAGIQVAIARLRTQVGQPCHRAAGASRDPIVIPLRLRLWLTALTWTGLPADQEGEEGSGEARARGGDAAANLQGMRMILSSASGQGRVLEDSGSAREKVVARAPPYDAVRHRVVSSLHGKGYGPGLGVGGACMHPYEVVW